MKDGYIDIPLEIKEKLKSNQDIKLIILKEENDKDEIDKIELIREMRGAYKGFLSSSQEFSKMKKNEKLLEERKFNLDVYVQE